MQFRDDFRSSSISAIAYEESQQILVVFFKLGQVYRYEGIALPVLQGFLNADSKGKYFVSNIRENYLAELLAPAEIDELRRSMKRASTGENHAWLISVLSRATTIRKHAILF